MLKSEREFLFGQMKPEDAEELRRWINERGLSDVKIQLLDLRTPEQREADRITTRLGELCWVTAGATSWIRGRLLMWAQSDDGDGVYPVAVIEVIETGCVERVGVRSLCFAAECPGEIKSTKKGG